MAKQPQETIEYSEDTQLLFLRFLVSDNSAFVRCQTIIRPEYWNDRLKATVRYILKYAGEYSLVPPPELIKATTGIDLDPIENLSEQYIKSFLDMIEAFCRHKAMELLILEGPDLIGKGLYSEIDSRSKENLMITLNRDLGSDYFDNPLARMERVRSNPPMTSTGWRDIDSKLYGGFNRGELSFFVGGSGSGKSLFLQNIALNWVQQGLDVVYITLELSEDLVARRFDAMITGMSTKDVFKKYEDAAMTIGVQKKSKKWGRLQIKKMSEAGTNANMIRAYLNEYEIRFGKLPDAICVDYLDLLHPNSGKVGPSDLFVKDKYTSEELRGLAGELNLLAVTASQLNRSATQEQDFDHSHIAGGISKINTADNVLGIYVTAAMKERGEYQIQFLKTRSSNGVGQRVYLKFSPESLRIIDMDEEDQPKATGLAAIQQDLQAKRAISNLSEKKSDFSDKRSNVGTSVAQPGSEDEDAPKVFQRAEFAPPSPSEKNRQAGAQLRNLIGKIRD